MEEGYHIRLLFYPVKSLSDGGQDHSELFVLLAGIDAGRGCLLACSRSAIAEVTNTTLAHTSYAAPPPVGFAAASACWVHETTNDDKFTGRDDEIGRLNRDRKSVV